MDANNLYQQISQRTDGSVYIGVVGPVRTGKSTFIKRFMEQLVLPNIENVYRRERAKDELPQSGSGKTIMTSEPKFVPEEAVEISPDGKNRLSVRLIDSVGYLIPGAIGAEEEGTPRLVTTPWASEQIPMAEAAELGTKKVMEEHSSVGIVITTDGSVTDIPREDYLNAEQRAIADMQATGKPFVVLLNTQQPESDAAQTLCAQLEAQYGVQCLAVNCLSLELEDIQRVLAAILAQFPITELDFFLPDWVTALEDGSTIKAALYGAMRQSAEQTAKLSDAQQALEPVRELSQVENVDVRQTDLGTGVVECVIAIPAALFYEVLSQKSGFEVSDDAALMALLTELAQVKSEYDKVAAALEQVRATGYGIVMPTPDEMTLEEPQIIKKNGNYAVRLRASAPSIHMMRADIETEVSPMVGDEKQSEELIEYLLGEYEDDTQKLWQSNIFGKSLYDLVTEGLSAKLKKMPEDARMKLKQTLTRIINENSGGLICIIL